MNKNPTFIKDDYRYGFGSLYVLAGQKDFSGALNHMKGHADSVALLLIQLDMKVYLSKGILEQKGSLISVDIFHQVCQL